MLFVTEFIEGRWKDRWKVASAQTINLRLRTSSFSICLTETSQPPLMRSGDEETIDSTQKLLQVYVPLCLMTISQGREICPASAPLPKARGLLHLLIFKCSYSKVPILSGTWGVSFGEKYIWESSTSAAVRGIEATGTCS